MALRTNRGTVKPAVTLKADRSGPVLPAIGHMRTMKVRNRAAQNTTLINNRATDKRLDVLEDKVRCLIEALQSGQRAMYHAHRKALAQRRLRRGGPR